MTSFLAVLYAKGDRSESSAPIVCLSLFNAGKGAGSGMAGMAAAIPIQNLVWRRHTNQK